MAHGSGDNRQMTASDAGTHTGERIGLVGGSGSKQAHKVSCLVFVTSNRQDEWSRCRVIRKPVRPGAIAADEHSSLEQGDSATIRFVKR